MLNLMTAIAAVMLTASVASGQVAFTPQAIPPYQLNSPYKSPLIRAVSPKGLAYVNYHVVSKLPNGLKVGFALPETGLGVAALHVYGTPTETRIGTIKIVGRDAAGNVAVRYYYLIPK